MIFNDANYFDCRGQRPIPTDRIEPGLSIYQAKIETDQTATLLAAHHHGHESGEPLTTTSCSPPTHLPPPLLLRRGSRWPVPFLALVSLIQARGRWARRASPRRSRFRCPGVGWKNNWLPARLSLRETKTWRQPSGAHRVALGRGEMGTIRTPAKRFITLSRGLRPRQGGKQQRTSRMRRYGPWNVPGITNLFNGLEGNMVTTTSIMRTTGSCLRRYFHFLWLEEVMWKNHICKSIEYKNILKRLWQKRFLFPFYSLIYYYILFVILPNIINPI